MQRGGYTISDLANPFDAMYIFGHVPLLKYMFRLSSYDIASNRILMVSILLLSIYCLVYIERYILFSIV